MELFMMLLVDGDAYSLCIPDKAPGLSVKKDFPG